MCDDIIEITNNNKYLLEEFLKNELSGTFRYFNKRSIDVIQNHVITVLVLVGTIPIGYAHIDYDSGKYWFGICILENYQGNGYGKKIMEYIFNHDKIKKMGEIYLTVDKINTVAIKLYTKFDFTVIDKKETYFIMMKQIY